MKYSKILYNNDNVLDFGCGDGRITSKIAEHNKRVTGIDINKKAIEKAIKNNKKKNLRFKNINILENSKTLKKYDLIIARDIFQVFDNKTKIKALNILKKHLIPGGYIIISEFNRNVLINNVISHYLWFPLHVDKEKFGAYIRKGIGHLYTSMQKSVVLFKFLLSRDKTSAGKYFFIEPKFYKKNIDKNIYIY